MSTTAAAVEVGDFSSSFDWKHRLRRSSGRTKFYPFGEDFIAINNPKSNNSKGKVVKKQTVDDIRCFLSPPHVKKDAIISLFNQPTVINATTAASSDATLTIGDLSIDVTATAKQQSTRLEVDRSIASIKANKDLCPSHSNLHLQAKNTATMSTGGHTIPQIVHGDDSTNNQHQDIADLKDEISKLENELDKLKEGSIEFMLKEMRLDMKRDALRLLNNNVTTTTKIEKDLQSLKQNTETMQTKICSLETECSSIKMNLQTHENILHQVCEKVSFLQGIVTKQAQQIELLQQHKDSVELCAMKQDVIISGIDEDEGEDTQLIDGICQ